MAADRVRRALNARPVVRQFTQRDPLALGRAAQSKRSATLRPRIEDAALDPSYTVEPQRTRADKRGTHAQER